ncbi:MAG: hypothetical protein CUN56_07165 [Phototrophicales bacterium]|nr:MAG: hypothetical protein CUN56_07165 [Phototrophicales bacterium]RMG77189.1 MAG: hypothetical protein D6711_02150 [Chloroflexota bacterium]
MILRSVLFPLPFAFVWMALTQQTDLVSFALGYVIAFAISLLITTGDERRLVRINYIPRRVGALLRYSFILSRDIFMAGIDVSLRVMGFRPIDRSGIIAVEVKDQSALMAALSAHSITITPGELVVEFDEQAGVMYVHCLDVERSLPKAAAEQEERLKLFKRILDRD